MSRYDKLFLLRQIARCHRSCRTGADPGFTKGGGLWQARGARTYNGGLGAQPPAWSRGRAGKGQGVKPPEAVSFSSIFIQKSQNVSMFGPWGRPAGPPIPASTCDVYMGDDYVVTRAY